MRKAFYESFARFGILSAIHSRTGPTFLDVFFEDAAKLGYIQLPVPDPMRINDEPGSGLADAEARRLGAKNGHGKFARLGLENVPERLAGGRVTTIRPHAKEEMPGRGGDFRERHFRIGRVGTRFVHVHGGPLRHPGASQWLAADFIAGRSIENRRNHLARGYVRDAQHLQLLA